MNVFQNFPSEGSEDEAWLPHLFMADVSLGSTNIAHLRAVFLYISPVAPGHGRDPGQKAEYFCTCLRWDLVNRS